VHIPPATSKPDLDTQAGCAAVSVYPSLPGNTRTNQDLQPNQLRYAADCGQRRGRRHIPARRRHNVDSYAQLRTARSTLKPPKKPKNIRKSENKV
ncbi:hypothetical protein PCANC_27898, partial [Puccinia coronata f. sp. avenae]